MERSLEQHDPQQPAKKAGPSTYTREMLFLAEEAAEGTIQVLPGKEWAFHYPVASEVRAEKLQGLLDGTYAASDIAHDLKPDALFYNADDIAAQGLQAVSSRIRDISAFITHYDYPRFAKFVSSMRGRDIPLPDIDALYNALTQTRTERRMMDAYGYTGKKQIEQALHAEMERTSGKFSEYSRQEKVLKALKANWLCEELGQVSAVQRDEFLARLSGEERALFEKLQEAYRAYIQHGDEEAYQRLVESLRDGLPNIQKDPGGEEEPSASMQELEKELEPYKDRVVPPGTLEDPAIPPDDADEYHTPPPMPGVESKEQRQARPIFEIEPPLGGYYASGRKSYYDIDTKTWSKKKQLTPYTASLSGSVRHTIAGALDSGLKSLPLPTTYALHTKSLKYKGAEPKFFRDQNGCFYIETHGPCSFSVEFFEEPAPFTAAPIPEDAKALYRGSLSSKTEAALSRFSGSAIAKAEQARQHILSNHFYPGGGDLQTAQALQYKLRTESTGDTYLQNIDASEYLECYSANTLLCALLRKTGVPARLVVGHKVEGARDGTSAITESTGHAWSEIWDGKAWRRFDATPQPKPEDKKPPEKDGARKKESAPEADDNGVDAPQQGKKQDKEQAADVGSESKDSKGAADEQKQGKSGSGKDAQNLMDQMSEASDAHMEQSQKELAQAKEQLEKMLQQKQQLDQKISDAQKFQDLADLQKAVENGELFEDLKKELEEKLEAKEQEMKGAVKEAMDRMVEDGFMDEQEREKREKELEEKRLEELDKLQKEIEQENALYNEYEDIREEVMPLVEKWFRYFAERLPRQEEVGLDEDSLTRQGAFSRRSIMKPRNLLFGMVKNPREINPSVKPRFMASILVDVSGSMKGEKLRAARKLLIFYSELFSRISEAFGYIRFSVNIFSDGVTDIKGFAQEYASPQRYSFDDGSQTTVKVRLMQKLKTAGGTNMLDGIKKAAADLNKEIAEYPDYASALYFTGDGGDTCGNAGNIKKFLQMNDAERGFGEHMYSAFLLGNESQRKELADIFGDEHTNVTPDLDDLIERNMDQFDADLEEYLKTKTK